MTKIKSQLVLFEPLVGSYGEPAEGSRRCENPLCPTGLYHAEDVKLVFGSQQLCRFCRLRRKHEPNQVMRRVADREYNHAQRQWMGWPGGSVADFRAYLHPDAWNHRLLAQWILDAINRPCSGCVGYFEILGDMPYLIQNVDDAYIDVKEPEAKPGMRNLQILGKTCSREKWDHSTAEWMRIQQLYEEYAVNLKKQRHRLGGQLTLDGVSPPQTTYRNR